MSISNPVRTRPVYGLPVGKTLLSSAITVLVLAALAWLCSLSDWTSFLSYLWLAVAVLQILHTVSYLYTTRRGRFRVWATILDDLELRGDERVLDLGSGRGQVLNAVAKRLTTGIAVGLDAWRDGGGLGGDEPTARRNAEAEGVGDRVALVTADMTALPQADGEFDVVLSSLAIREVTDAADRDRALDEAVRVLRSGGRLAVVDFRRTEHYARRLTDAGLVDVERRGLGWRFWFGGPWAVPSLVTARKP